MSLVLLVVLTIAGTAFVLEPCVGLFGGEGSGPNPLLAPAKRELDELNDQKETILWDLRELDLDLAAGKLEPEDYELLRDELLSRVSRLYDRIDHVELAVDARRATFFPSRPSASAGSSVASKSGRVSAVEGEPTPFKECPDCQWESSARANYCEECGRRFTKNKFCIDCGEPLIDAACYCVECGAKVA